MAKRYKTSVEKIMHNLQNAIQEVEYLINNAIKQDYDPAFISFFRDYRKKLMRLYAELLK